MYSTVEKFYNHPSLPQSKLRNENYTPVVAQLPEPALTLKWQKSTYPNTANPDVWGPAFWFSLHNGALRYPEKASPLVVSRMKGFLLGLPEMVPCIDCKEHARVLLESTDLDEVTKGRESSSSFSSDSK